jgi:hypothetical protein
VTHIHINVARFSRTECAVVDCPTCQRPRRMLARFQEWYGWMLTCTGCGEQWQDGEHGGREFRPGWRQESIRHARSVLASIGIPS